MPDEFALDRFIRHGQSADEAHYGIFVWRMCRDSADEKCHLYGNQTGCQINESVA